MMDLIERLEDRRLLSVTWVKGATVTLSPSTSPKPNSAAGLNAGGRNVRATPQKAHHHHHAHHTIAVPPPPPVPIPDAPSNVTIKAVTNSTITLTYSDNSPKEASFELWRSINGGKFWKFETLNGWKGNAVAFPQGCRRRHRPGDCDPVGVLWRSIRIGARGKRPFHGAFQLAPSCASA